MSYDISINISASGADSVEREFKKIENAYKNLQSMGMNFSQASGIKNLAADINTLSAGITNFTTKISNAVTQMNSLAAAIKGAAANAQSLGAAFSTAGLSPTSGGGIGSSSSASKTKQQLTMVEAAIKKAEATGMSNFVGGLATNLKAVETINKAIKEGLDKTNPEVFKLYDYKQRLAQAKQEQLLGQYTPGLNPRFSSEGLHNDTMSSLVEAQRHKFTKYLASSPANIKEAESIFASGLDPATLAQYKQFLAIEGNKPTTMWNKITNSVMASPFGIASLFMLRYRVMTGILAAAASSAAVLSGHTRQDMVDPNFQLASIGFDAPMRASMEANAVGLSRKIPGLTMPQYFNAAAQVGSALDVKKHGQEAIARGTKASLVFGSLSNLPPDKAGELISNTYFALKDTPEFRGMSAGKAFEKIAGSMFAGISVSGAWGPDIQKAMAHFSPMGARANMSLDEMIAFVSTMKTEGFHAGSSGRGGKWLFGDKGYEFMARAMMYGSGDAGVDFYDVRTQEAMDALKKQGIKPGRAKQINEDVVRYLKPILASRIAEDPIGTLAMISEKVKSSLANGFNFKDLKASQDFLAQFSKLFLGSGVGDVQETLKRMKEEGGWEGANKKYDEANAEEPGAAWRKFYGSISNFSDALSNTLPIFKAVGNIGEFVTTWAERLTRENELNKGGNIDPRRNRKFSNRELGYAFGATEEAYRNGQTSDKQMRYLMESFASEDSEIVNKTIREGGKQRLALEKEYYANKWQQTIWPKELVMSGLFYKKFFGHFAKKFSKNKFFGWLFGSPEDTKIKPLFGDTSGLAQYYQDKLAEEKLQESPYMKGIEYRDRPDLLYTPSDREMFRNAKQTNAIAALKNSQFTGTAPYVWGRTWRSILGVESIEELFNKDKFTPENPPPIIDYMWGEGMSKVPGVPRMAQFFGDNMELPSPQPQGQQLDIGPLNSSLGELVSALQQAASKIKSIDIKGPSGDNPGKPVDHKWGKPLNT